MGNQSSSEGGHSRPFSTRGSLGLSRSELDKRCQPSGLYNNCQWDDKAIRKLVGDGKLASRAKGGECQSTDCNQECPICFLYYPEINVTKCCNANLCTECFLQVRPQKDKHSACPFCNSNKLSVSVAKKLSASQIQEREKEEQRAIEAVIRSRGKNNSKTCKDKENNDNDAEETNKNDSGFGTSLAQDSRVALMRARSESFASASSSEHNNHRDEDRLIKSLAMTPEERRRLEDEMKAQLSHPLSLRVEAEAEERRLENDRAYSRSHSGFLRAQRAVELFRNNSRYRGRRGGRDWNQIVDAFERGGNGEIQSLDDLVVLEAAILLSMDEESRQARNEDNNSSDGGNDFDAARHARDGFPLVRSFFANRNPEGGNNHSRRILDGSNNRPEGSMGEMAFDTAALLMRGISEEEQVAMAIAASMQDSQPQGGENDDSDDGSEDEDRSVQSSDDGSEGYGDDSEDEARENSDNDDDNASRDVSDAEDERTFDSADGMNDDDSVVDSVDNDDLSNDSHSVHSNADDSNSAAHEENDQVMEDQSEEEEEQEETNEMERLATDDSTE